MNIRIELLKLQTNALLLDAAEFAAKFMTIAEEYNRLQLLQQTPCTTLSPDSKDEYRVLVDGQRLMLGTFDECKTFAEKLTNVDKRKIIIVATVWRR